MRPRRKVLSGPSKATVMRGLLEAFPSLDARALNQKLQSRVHPPQCKGARWSLMLPDAPGMGTGLDINLNFVAHRMKLHKAAPEGFYWAAFPRTPAICLESKL
jgi:hypothetical protein